MTLYRAGDAIAGEKILFRFGNYSRATERNRTVGTLGQRGTARVQKPLKRSVTGQGKERDSIDCLAATYNCAVFSVSSQKVPLKGHTAFEGFLKGEARCVIKLPHPNHPQ